MTKEKKLLDEIVDRLVRALGPEQIYLFGSRARGDSHAESDFDLLVVLFDSDLPGYQRDRQALRALRGIPAALDVMVLTKSEFERKLEVVCSLPATVSREGERLYAA